MHGTDLSRYEADDAMRRVVLGGPDRIQPCDEIAAKTRWEEAGRYHAICGVRVTIATATGHLRNSDGIEWCEHPFLLGIRVIMQRRR